MSDTRIKEIFSHFEALFGPAPRCELNYTSDIELLVAIILSAQCTDKRVNMVTPILFAKYKSVEDFANADQAELEQIIYSTGFYRNKAKNIIALCKILVARGGIPTDIDELANLPGIGRKTGNVFLAEFHGIPAIGVDTHVIRLSNRLGFTTSQNPVVVERDLAKIWPRENWGRYHLYMVLFGRYRCKSMNPDCANCGIIKLCSWTKLR
ncbi:MAG: endonuclease III [Firmicutes bacterium]|nr:endonuclease III [Bacillota bacterium]